MCNDCTNIDVKADYVTEKKGEAGNQGICQNP